MVYYVKQGDEYVKLSDAIGKSPKHIGGGVETRSMSRERHTLAIDTALAAAAAHLNPGDEHACMISMSSFDPGQSDNVPRAWQLCLHKSSAGKMASCYDIREFAKAFVMKAVVPDTGVFPTSAQIQIIVDRVRSWSTEELSEFLDPNPYNTIGRQFISMLRHCFDDGKGNNPSLEEEFEDLPTFDIRHSEADEFETMSQYAMLQFNELLQTSNGWDTTCVQPSDKSTTWNQSELLRYMYDKDTTFMEYEVSDGNRTMFAMLRIPNNEQPATLGSVRLTPTPEYMTQARVMFRGRTREARIEKFKRPAHVLQALQAGGWVGSWAGVGER